MNLLSLLFVASSAFARGGMDRFCNAGPDRCHGDKSYSCTDGTYLAKIHIVEKGLDPRSFGYTYYDVTYKVSRIVTGKTLLNGKSWGDGDLEQERPPILNYSFAPNPNSGALFALWLHTDDARYIQLHYYAKTEEVWMGCTVDIVKPTF